MTTFKVGQKTVDVFQSENPNRPVIYLNTYGREGEAVFRQLSALGDLDFTLVAISGLNWEHDMAPWDIPPISSKNTPCTGGADVYLELLLHEILPQAEKNVLGTPLWRGIAGYSLAGCSPYIRFTGRTSFPVLRACPVLCGSRIFPRLCVRTRRSKARNVFIFL